MKKLIFSALALIGLLAVSCNKEKEMPVLRTDEPVNTHTVSIKASIAPETRTSYADDKTFSWVENDSITVVTLSPDEEYIRLVTFYAQSSGPETIFSGEVEEGYTLYNMAFYAAAGTGGVHFGGEDDSNLYYFLPAGTSIDGDTKTEYTVESANPLSNLPLIGVKKEEDDSYLFYTATGAAKFSFTDVPEGAAYFVIEYSDEPLSGYFTWNDEGIITNDSARPGTYTYQGSDGQEHTASYANGFVFYHFDRNADGSGTIYMPLPVGRIPAGARIDFYDEELEEVLYSRLIPADIPIERNRVTEVASFSATTDWESLGYGYYYDLPVFYYMTPEADREGDTAYAMSAVEIFRDKNAPRHFRMDNPFPIAAEKRGYTIDPSYEMEDYLTYDVLKDDTVIYEDIATGYTYSSTSGNSGQVYLLCPGQYGNDNSFNFVPKYQENGLPQEIFFSSYYVYSDSYYFWLDPGTIHSLYGTLLFPDVEEQLSLDFAVKFESLVDNTPAQPVGKVTLTLGTQTDIPAVDLVVARDAEEAEAMIADGKALRVTEGGSFNVNFPAEAPTATYHAFAKLAMPEDFTQASNLMLASDEEYDYFRADEDRELTIDDIAGNYSATADYYLNGRWSSKSVNFTMTVEESDDVLSGDIMFTNFCPEYAALLGRNATILPVYAWFDTATGVITVPGGQTVYEVGTGLRKVTYTLVDYDDKPNLTFYLKDTGVIYSKSYICFMQGTNFTGVIDEMTTFTRSDVSAGAPAVRAPRHTGREFLSNGKREYRMKYLIPVNEPMVFKGRLEQLVK
jgi:hypothetical protein